MDEKKIGLIYEKIPAIMKEIQAIGKNRKNEAQKYSFRGVDDVYNEAHDIFAKHKVFTVPTVLDSHHEERKSKSGSTLIYRIYTIKYTFYAEDGSFIEATVIGEGMDTGDKAGNKAMSVAHKYALLQVLLIPTDEPKDPENESHQLNGAPKSQAKAKKAKTQPEKEHEEIDTSDAFRNIPLVKTDGSQRKVTKFEALGYFSKIKEAIGKENYYEILGSSGYAKSNEVPEKNIPKIYALMVEFYQDIQEADQGEEDDDLPF